MNVLVIDIGGTGVKLLATGQTEPRRFESGKHLTPQQMVDGVKKHAAGWDYAGVSVGYPGRVGPDGPECDPGNLGDGWVGFDYEAAFGTPVRFFNDAAMQALGAYDDKRMLFLGLGTGLGSALVTDKVVVPLELGRLTVGGEPLGDRLGKTGFERDRAKWHDDVTAIGEELRDALHADYIVFGGGNAKELDPLPPNSRRGGNDDAFAGGFKLWAENVRDSDRLAPWWRVVG